MTAILVRSSQPDHRPLWQRMPALRLATDERFDLAGQLFGLALASHTLESISEKIPAGPLEGYLERWALVRPTIGWPSWTGIALDTLLLLGSLALLVLPRKRELLAALSVPLALSLLLEVDRYPSHAALLQFALVLVLVLAFGEALGAASSRTTETAWLDGTRRGLLGLLVLSYLFSALYKLNSGWFGLESDGIGFLVGLSKQIGLFTLTRQDLVGSLILVAVIAIEAALPFLLLWPRSRKYGLLLGVSFHLVILVRSVVDFSILALAFYPLVLTSEQLQQLLTRAKRRPSALGLAVLLMLTGFLFGLYRRGEVNERPGVRFFPLPLEALDKLCTLLVIVVFLYALFVLFSWRDTPPIRQTTVRLSQLGTAQRRGLVAVGLVLLLYSANNLAPFFALPNAGPMWMYSSIDPRAYGHFLLPRRPLTSLFSYAQQLEVGPASRESAAAGSFQAFAASLRPTQVVHLDLVGYQVTVVCRSALGLQFSLRYLDEQGQRIEFADACQSVPAPTMLLALLKPNECIPGCRDLLTRWAYEGVLRR